MGHKDKLILYVDDDADDRQFLTDAFRLLCPDVRVVLAENGISALEYLNSSKDSDGALPSLIILDLNMPYLDGRETFERIRSNPSLKHIPTIVFTSTHNPADKAMFNSLGIELITKPDNLAYLNTIAGHMLEVCE
jgi:CheY-like chemotaxis protein